MLSMNLTRPGSACQVHSPETLQAIPVQKPRKGKPRKGRAFTQPVAASRRAADDGMGKRDGRRRHLCRNRCRDHCQSPSLSESGSSWPNAIPISFSTPIPTPTPILSAFLCLSLSAIRAADGRPIPNGAKLSDASDHNHNPNRNRNPFYTSRLRLRLRLRRQ